ncbi:MAG: RluA family pseudouridine synthase [Acidimicrobiia bacterium]|nr:RluA family pseudouridine synthase [Acidimicrobiia bacterium]
MPRQTAEVPASLAGERADKVVAALAGISRTLARRLLEEGRATVDGRSASPREPLQAGARLEVDLPLPEVLQPDAVPFQVRYEDEHLAVIDKPAGVVVHPGAGRGGAGTLAAGILQRWPGIRGVGEEGRWGIVHRLDQDTSGLLVVALSREAFPPLRQMLGRHEAERTYLALVHGIPAAATGTIEAALGRDPRRRGRVRVHAGGRSARTHYRVRESWPGASLALLEMRLETGRTHQIRVHLSAIGHPIVADRRYGRDDGLAPRTFLHACRLRFTHPITGADVDVESPLPADLAEARARLGEPAGG